VALARWAHEGKTKVELAKEIGVTPQSLNSWQTACKEDRNFLLPAVTAAKIAKATGLSPRLFRPDIWSLYGNREGGSAAEEC
jgi:DNA-binding transcriptional regulator YdaS (Cro superfamily)